MTMKVHHRWYDRSYWRWLRYQASISATLKPGRYKALSPFASFEGN